MPTKRPDQLPSGENFNFEDILMVEKNPDSSDRKLNKVTIRDFMKVASEFDPNRVGENPILGFQSSFEWMVGQINTLSENPINGITPYDEFQSETKNSELVYITPSPTPTTSITPTPTLTPFRTPLPTPSVTPTPSKQFARRVQLSFDGPKPQSASLPIEYLPEARGFTSWRIVGGQSSDNTSLVNFNGYFPDSFTPSALNEVLIFVNKVDNGHVQISSAIEDEDGDIQFIEGLFESASITFTIDYS